MSDLIKNSLLQASRLSKRALRKATSESSMRALRHGVRATRERSGQTIHVVAQAPATQKVASATRIAVQSGPAKEIAKICGRAGLAGAVVDGAIGGLNGYRAMQAGKINAKQVLIHTGSEAGCGFVTSSSGTAGTIAAYMVTGTMGPAALICGMGASLGSRYVYRKIVGEPLPLDDEQSAKTDEEPVEQTKDDSPLEDIGPQK